MLKIPPTDEELVQRSLKNVDQFGFLVMRYEQRLARYIRRISNFTKEETEDALQEIFIKTWKNLNAFDGRVKFSSWIYRIAHNHTISQYRKHKARKQDKQVALDPTIYDPPTGDISATEHLLQEQTANKIRATLDTLPAHYREILVLRFFEERTYKEIGDILKKPPGSVATLIHRAKKKFQKAQQRQNEQAKPPKLHQ